MDGTVAVFACRSHRCRVRMWMAPLPCSHVDGTVAVVQACCIYLACMLDVWLHNLLWLIGRPECERRVPARHTHQARRSAMWINGATYRQPRWIAGHPVQQSMYIQCSVRVPTVDRPSMQPSMQPSMPTVDTAVGATVHAQRLLCQHPDFLGGVAGRSELVP